MILGEASRSNDAVEKVGEGLRHPNFGGLLTIPCLPTGPLGAFYEVDFLDATSRNFRKEFFYSLNDQAQGRCAALSGSAPRTAGFDPTGIWWLRRRMTL